MSFTGKQKKDTYKDILQVGNSNNGISTSVTNVKSGDGSSSSLSVSDRALQVKSLTDNTAALDVQDASGTKILIVDTTNSIVKANNVHVNTQYANFGFDYSGPGSMVVNTHTAISYNHFTGGGGLALGTGTDPATSLTIATTAHEVVNKYWYVMDNITIDRVVWWSGADAATGDTTRCHVMSYDIDSDNGSTGGDLSSGVVLADGADITNAGYEQLYYQQMTLQSANVTAGKIILFTFRSDSVNSDFSINATIKYHITG